jgi:hypothetical protein
MRSALRQALGVIVLAAAAFAPTGCSHDTLGGASQGLHVTFRPSPTGAGRYESASFIIDQILVLPADPATAALYTDSNGVSHPLRFRRDPLTANLTLTADVPYADIALATGTYRVTLIDVHAPVLLDQDLSATPASCIEGIAVIDGTSPPDQVPVLFSFTDPASLTFTIRPGQTDLALTVNVPGLIAGYESSYTCQLGCGPGGSPCFTAFNTTAFRAALLANMTLE